MKKETIPGGQLPAGDGFLYWPCGANGKVMRSKKI